MGISVKLVILRAGLNQKKLDLSSKHKKNTSKTDDSEITCYSENGDLLSSGKTSTLTWHQNIMVDTGPLKNELIITPNMLVESNPMQVHRSGFHNLWQTQRRSKTKCTTNV